MRSFIFPLYDVLEWLATLAFVALWAAVLLISIPYMIVVVRRMCDEAGTCPCCLVSTMDDDGAFRAD